jgi:hypothetical protein
MTRWMHPPERDRQDKGGELDPVVAGARYGLSRELSLAIWKRACTDATDASGRRDTEQAWRQFHELAARVAARGGRLRPDAGKLTRVGVETGDTISAAPANELVARVPGRRTRMATEAERWAQRVGQHAASAEDRAALEGTVGDEPALRRDEPPAAEDMVGARVALQSSESPERAEPQGPGFARGSRQFDIPDPSEPSARDPRVGWLLPATPGRMERLFGRRSAMLESRPGGAELSADRQAVTRGRPRDAAAPSHAMVSMLDASARASRDAAIAHSTLAALPGARFAARTQSGSHDASHELIEQVLAMVSTSDHGTPLSGELAARMKAELGSAEAFDHVRIHTDDCAAQAARLLGAQAFTLGHHVYFDRGEFAPGTEHGDRLLRHELTHVAQHARGELAGHRALEVVPESSTTEAEARAAEAGRGPRHTPLPEAAHAGGAIAGRPGATSVIADTAPGASAPPAHGAAPAMSAASPASTPIARAPAVGAAGKPKGAALPVVNLLGMKTFEPPVAVADAIDKAGDAGADVRVTFGKLTQSSVIRVKKAEGRYVTDETKPQLVPLLHPLFMPVKGLTPVLRVQIGNGGAAAITGYVTLDSAPDNAQGLQQALIDRPELLGLRGFAMPALAITNSLEGGTLTVDSQQAIPFSLGGWVNGQVRFGLINSAITFDARANVHARGLEDGELVLGRDAHGIKGSVALAVKLGDKFSGKAIASYEKGDVVVKGQIGYHSEKLSGTLGIVIADAAQAEQMVRSQIDPSALVPQAAGAGGGASTGGERAIAGWGDLDFAFTDWLTGKAKVVYGPSGHITVIGKIAPPKQIDLMKSPKGVRIPILPDLNIEAKYGIPYLADIHVGIGVGLAATAGLGPIYMTDLAIDGIYSTDPAVLNRFSITGALRAQADAGLELTVRAYAGLTVLFHSVNFGAQIVGKAGLRAYAEARPTLGYRETASPSAGKKGEYYLQGHLEMAAQPVLSLAGSLYVQVSGPVTGDRIWPWQLGSVEYPIPTQMGIGADVDYVIGSGKLPEVKLTKPSFDPSKFVDSMMDNHLPSKTGRDQQQKKGSFAGVPPANTGKAPAALPKKPTPEPNVSSGGAPARGTGMQSEQDRKNVPANQQAAQKWAAGMQALRDLGKRAEKDAEDDSEIHAHLAGLKAAHGFTALTASRDGDSWTVHAAMGGMQSDVKVKAEKPAPGKDAKPGDGKSGKDAKPGDGKSGKDAKPGDAKQIGARITFQAHGETHTQYIDLQGAAPVAMVASTPSAVKAKIAEWQPRLRELSDANQKRAGQLIGQAIAIEGQVAGLAVKVKAGTGDAAALEAKQRELANALTGLFEIIPQDGSKGKDDTGARLAREAGYPPAEAGYHWAAMDGKPVYKRNPGNGGPQRRYDATEKKFKDVSGKWDSYQYSDLGTKAPCFAPGTLVKTPSGDRPIESIQEGDEVLAFSTDTNRVVVRQVTRLLTSRTEHLVRIAVAGEVVSATRLHRFWVDGEDRYVRAMGLEQAMPLYAMDGGIEQVASLQLDAVASLTFNLEVETDHNYFVGRRGLLVHNGHESAFASKAHDSIEIYAIVDKRTRKYIYIGQTRQGYATRFEQHLATKPAWKAREKDLYPITVDNDSWTPYEAAVWELHYIKKCSAEGHPLENKGIPIGEAKFGIYHDHHTPCP